MTVIRKNRSGNTELEKRAHTSAQENRKKIDKSKQMKKNIKTKSKIHKLKNKIYTVDLVSSKKKKLLYMNKKRKYK